MKRFSTIVLTVSAVFFSLTISSQTWTDNLPQEKIKNGEELTFFEIQKAFNDYWDPLNVENGYYLENGLQKKATGWKQFKRWEWYWEMRIDPTSGAFPKSSAAEIRKQMNIASGIRNADGNWLNLGPSTTPGGYAGLGRLNCIAFLDGDSDTFFAGSPSGGLWKTTDAGTSWTVLTDENDALGVSDVLVYASVTPGSETIFIATGDRDGGSLHSLGGGQSHDNNTVGVLKSTDGGTTWATTDLEWVPSDKKTVNRLLKHPTDDDIIYASGSDGVFKTTDAGASWPLLSGIAEFIDMEFKPTDPGILYGSTRAGKVYKSGDGGASWSPKLDVTDAKRVELAVSEDEPGWVYAVVVNSARGLEGIHKSDDSGETWTKVFDGSIAGNNLLGNKCDGTALGGQGTYDLAIAADPSDADIVYVGGVSTWKSTDGGSSWSIANMWKSDPCGAPVVHADKHSLVFQPVTGDLFECNDGGLYKTANGGTTWPHLGSGLIISQLYRLGVSQLTSNNVIAGLQDNGTKSLLTGTWADVVGGDGMECFIDYTDDDTQYASLYYGRVFRTTNGWSSYTEITGGLSGSAAWVTPFTIDPITNTTIYVARDTVWKSLDQGATWSKISDFDIGGTTFRSMAVAPSDPDTIYAATRTKIWATYDGGTVWSEITGTLPVGSSYITYITVNSDFADTLWVAMGEYNTHGVYESTDAGASWTDISSGLPSIPVMSVVQNRQNTTEIELYAATDLGVYVKVGSADWAFYSEGLPNVVVTEVEIYYDDAKPNRSRLRAATYGRGLWESELYLPAGPPTADFDADETEPLVDSVVVFTDITINDPTSWSWTFTPSTVSYVNSTSSTSQNPEVSFDVGGSYDVELTATNASGSDVETKIAYITVVAPHKWVGSTSTEWDDASNWDLATVPDETKHVIIESGASFYPEVPANFYINSGGSAYKCKSLTIKSGGLATIGNAGGGAGSDMIVYGNLKVETGGILKIADDLSLESGGNFYVTGGTVESFINTSTGFGDWLFKTGSGGYMTGGVLTVFSDLIFYGGSNWSVSGGTFHMGGSAAIVTVITADSDLQLNDFIVDAGVTAFISTSSSAPLSVSADFTMDAGSKFSISAGETLLISGDVLMKSDASSSSSLINLGTMTISGTSTVERFMTDDQWHLLSSPVGGATASSLYFSGSPKVHLKKYLEASNTWEFITALSTPLMQGRGFAYWIDEATFRSDVTVAFTGSSLLSSDLTLTSFGYSGDTDHGYNMVGNPFPSAIDWDEGSWDTTDIRGNIWVWEDGGSGDGSGTYKYRNAQEAGSLTDGIIPLAQGFFIQTTSATASLTIPADARLHSSIPYYKSSGNELTYPYAVFEVSHVGKKDEVWLTFNEGLSEGFDNGWDVNKLFSSGNYPQLYLEESEFKLSIDALPLLEDKTRVVSLSYKPDKSGEHILSLKDFQNMENAEIVLEDLFTSHFQNMIEDGVYHFTASKNDEPKRFLLHFNPLTIGIENQHEPLVNIYASSKVIYINYGDFSAHAFVTVYDLLGREIVKQKLTQSKLNTINVNLSNSTVIVKTVDDENVTVEKLFIR